MHFQGHRPPSQPGITPIKSSSGPDVPSTLPPASDSNSVYSFLSSSDHTAISSVHSPAPPKYSYDLTRDSSIASTLTRLASEYDYGYPKKEKAEPASWAHTPARRELAGSSFQYKRPTASPHAHSRIALTTSEDLVAVLGPDNAPYDTEIDTLPCAGVRIPYGSLTGQLAWRMVVHTILPSKDRHWWPAYSSIPSTSAEPCTCSSCASKRRSFDQRNSTLPHNSIVSLPLDRPYSNPSDTDTGVSVPQRRTAHHPDLPRIVTNFILDSSLPHSVISRDALVALGLSEDRLPGADYDPHGEEADDDERRGEDVLDSRTQLVLHKAKGKRHECDKGIITGVTLSIQGVKTRARVAREGEASRIGVQFLKDAGASLMFPGDGVGPVLYLEAMGAVKNAPRTVTGLPRWKYLTLPQRVKLILGLSS